MKRSIGPVLRWGIAMVCLAGAAAGCSQSQCGAACESSMTLTFDSPIGQVGDYVFVIGDSQYPITLPSSYSGPARFQDFQVVGFEWHNQQPSRSLHVQIWKDGTEILDGEATLISYGDHEVCGMKCKGASFHMAVPAWLARTWGPCDQTQLTGQYAVSESSAWGGCSKVFSSTTLELDNGLVRMKDATCQSTLTNWSAETCNIQSTIVCSSDTTAVTWTLKLTDVIGDGSRLLGGASVEMTAPVACQSSASLELIRQ